MSFINNLPGTISSGITTVVLTADLPLDVPAGSERYSLQDGMVYVFDGVATWTALSGGGGGGGITALTGDVTASGSGAVAATVQKVGGSNASAVNTATIAANAATNLNTASTIVKRDSSGNFSAGTITAALTGTASGNPPNSRAINTSAPLTGGGDLSADRTLSIPVATNSQDGYLSAADHTTFSNAAAGSVPTSRTISTTAPLAGGGDLSANRTLSISQATTSTNGYLSSTDWNTFNNKQSTLTIGNLTDVGTDGITVTGGTGAVIGSGTSISQHVADATHNGYLSSTDWNTFNNKQGTITTGNLTDVGTDGITVTGGTGAVLGSGTSISQHVADATHNGYLSSTDWSTFNGKQSALTLGNISDVGTDGITITGGTGAIIGSGVTVSQHVADTTHSGYLSSSDWNTFNSKQASGNYITALTGDVSASGPGSASSTVNSVGGSTASAVNSATVAANAATALNTPSTIVARDSSGNFAAGTITAALTGTASGNPPNSRTISTSAPLAGGGDLSANRTLSISQSTTSTDGYLSSTDWNTFNNKVSTTRTISTSAPLTGGGNLSANLTLGIPVATNVADGYLSAADHSTFSATSAAAVTSLTGDVTGTGPGATATTLASVGTAGTYVKVTTDAKGRVTSGSASPLGISDGGTGQTTANAAFNALVPSQTSNSGKFLTTDGTNTSWATTSSGNPTSNVRGPESGTVTLTNSDNRIQLFNPTGNLTVNLPTTGVLQGDIWEIQMLESAGNHNVIVHSSNADVLAILRGGTQYFVALVNTPTAGTDWENTSPGQILGTQILNNAPVGYVGEILSQASQANPSIGNGDAQDVCTLTMSAGDWDVSASLQVGRNGATFSTNAQMIAAIITDAGNTLAGGVPGDNLLAQETQTNFDRFSVSFGTLRVTSDGTNMYIDGNSFPSTQTLRLKGYVNGYFSGTPYFDGSIRARRVR